MGLYARQDSPFWWMWLEGHKPESTGIRREAKSAEVRKRQKELAEEIYRARMGDLTRAAHRLPAKRTLPFSAFADWYEEHVLPAHRGRERELFAIAHLRAFFGDDDLLTITPARVSEYVTQRPRKPGTVNREVDVLKGILAAAVPRYLLASPLAGLKRQRTVKIQKRILEPDEEARLLAVLEPADRALYIVAVDTLIRLSNVVNLTTAENKGTHLELEDSKTGAYNVPLSDRARAALKSLTPKGGYYFPRRRGVKQPRNGIRLMLKYACARCEPKIPYGRAVAGITFHTGTRATGATRMLRRQVDPKTVQAIGNWKSFEQMGEYLQTDQALMLAAVNRIGPPALTPRSRATKKQAKSPMKQAAK